MAITKAVSTRKPIRVTVGHNTICSLPQEAAAAGLGTGGTSSRLFLPCAAPPQSSHCVLHLTACDGSDSDERVGARAHGRPAHGLIDAWHPLLRSVRFRGRPSSCSPSPSASPR